ncbi:hypothetical protein B0I72DRAFT_168410 [Yarrowia lipolytica]|jgi:cytochrome P450|uniref:YALI0B01848p n=2 Tax=Yarrowia lipolytica TaxID=4952 RepID=F2Z623_YARLI|nr:YALI0B01848p [Yarrowia lipolytica CLIB122]AOW01094.1 hypothetical protein YALI1_B02833g [Yarrowia lipolytica]KAB8281058.1 hypothetical protein BKA91DRAFT_159977 [Yarrowia lipolytica]KAE8172941.1 hypothetical protein BKA90DRAFT_96741 [Yarrowia lipolytica]KAJ8051994.1 hypothetical protein LXG23DRAFT_25568 [Yarrowia lipolytica]QNP95728.1 Cytochrome P450 52A12 [Yarrowia lipolytica]|eukprot:XP_500402.1 YALI0B01848p [Yarrowia lipolytica CLIB122]
MIQSVFLALAILIAYLGFAEWFSRFQHRRISKKKGCGMPPMANGGFLGWYGLYKTYQITSERTYPHSMRMGLEAFGHTFVYPVPGTDMLQTIHPDNIKAILATQFKDFSLGTRHKIMLPTLGDGIFTLDGEGWTHSRALLRPQFARDQVSHVASLERHIQVLFKTIKKENKECDPAKGFDIQELFFMLTLDTATEFLCGDSVDSLTDYLADPTAPQLDHSGIDENVRRAFPEAFNTAQWFCSIRAKLMKLYFFAGTVFYRKKYADANKIVHDFTDFYVSKALAARKEKFQELDQEGKYIFLYELAKETRNPKVLRDQMLNILLAGRDTTASLLSWVMFRMARQPETWKKLRQAVINDFGDTPDELSFESLKRCEYLRYVLNEGLRLYPSVPMNFRVATRDTTLPKGGGPDLDQPIFIPKGGIVVYSVYHTHRAEEYWGKDTEEFIPERWDPAEGYQIARGWEYLPFNGGPRICLGQQFALTEAGYVLARLAQEFETVTSCDDKPLPPKYNTHLTMSHDDGVWLKME